MAFRARVMLEAWVARVRRGSRWALRSFILAAELVERRGIIGLDERRARSGESKVVYLPSGLRAFAYSWCVHHYAEILSLTLRGQA